MNKKRVNIVGSYEAKLLSRDWIFRIFAFIAIVLIVIVQNVIQGKGGLAIWCMIALPSSVPWMNACLFNILQALVLIFVAGNSTPHGSRLEVMEMFHARSVGNGEYVTGRVLGFARVFLGLAILSAFAAVLFNILLSKSPFNPLIYVFYFLTWTIPTLFFFLGLVFFVSRVVSSRFVSLIILVSIFFASLFYLPSLGRGEFDSLGIAIPNVFSDMTGHVNLRPYLLQRFFFLTLGIALLGCSAGMWKRLDQQKNKHRIWTVSIVFGVLSVLSVLSYSIYFQAENRDRATYASTYLKHDGREKVRVEETTIIYASEGEGMRSTAYLRIHNPHKASLAEWVIYLNPGLRLTRLEETGIMIPHDRENQSILVKRPLESGETLDIRMDYEGQIEERVCYLDVPAKDYQETRWKNTILSFGKRNAFLGSDYTLLIPECLWYPVSYPPVKLSEGYVRERGFTFYTLKVVNFGNKTVIAPGEVFERGDTLEFRNRLPLPGLALCMGDYERELIESDSCQIEFYSMKGEGYFVKRLKEIKDHFPELSRAMWRSNGPLSDYPFSRIKLVETPVSFTSYSRGKGGRNEYVQPEMIFFPERWVKNLDFIVNMLYDRNVIIGGSSDENEDILKFSVVFNSLFVRESEAKVNKLTQIKMQKQKKSGGLKIESSLNPYSIRPFINNELDIISSMEYPFISEVLGLMLKFNDTEIRTVRSYFGTSEVSVKAVDYLSSNSLEEALTDKELSHAVLKSIFEFKSHDLKNRIAVHVPYEEFHRFVEEFKERSRFSNMDFKLFEEEFELRFQLELESFLSKWYKEKGLPRYKIKDPVVEPVETPEGTFYRVRVGIYNTSPHDGCISISAQGSPVYFQNFIVRAGESKEVRFLSEKSPSYLKVNTILSQNIPELLTFVAGTDIGVSPLTVRDTTQGIFDLPKESFLSPSDEIIVDNEDDEFSIIEKNKKSRLSFFYSRDKDKMVKTYMSFLEANSTRWTLLMYNLTFYGDYLRTAYAKFAGDGTDEVAWRVNLQETGVYEIFVYLPKDALRLVGKQYYRLEVGERQESLVSEVGEKGWIFLGQFDLPEGEVKLILTDKGNESPQIIYADAVKWVKVK